RGRWRVPACRAEKRRLRKPGRSYRRKRARSPALVQLLAIELPSAGIAARREGEALELSGERLRIGLSGKLLEVVTDELIYTCAHRLGTTPRCLNDLVVNR